MPAALQNGALLKQYSAKGSRLEAPAEEEGKLNKYIYEACSWKS